MLVRSLGAPPLDASVIALLGVTVVDGAAIEGTPLAEAFAKRRGPTALLLSRTGLPLLWRGADDPYLPAAVADLLR